MCAFSSLFQVLQVLHSDHFHNFSSSSFEPGSVYLSSCFSSYNFYVPFFLLLLSRLGNGKSCYGRYSALCFPFEDEVENSNISVVVG